MSKPTLNNQQFMKILKQACKDGKVDEDFLNDFLSNFHPYDLVYKRRD